MELVRKQRGDNAQNFDRYPILSCSEAFLSKRVSPPCVWPTLQRGSQESGDQRRLSEPADIEARRMRGRTCHRLLCPRPLQMIMARVLVGESTVGNKSMTRPPRINARGEDRLYDSTTDNVGAPTIFVSAPREHSAFKADPSKSCLGEGWGEPGWFRGCHDAATRERTTLLCAD